MKRLIDFYLTAMKFAVQKSFQYRLQSFFYLFTMFAEPVIYLVVWSTIAKQQGGSVGGYTVGGFAAYYITWTLLRNMNVARSPGDWEWRIQHGSMSAELLRPIHPIHNDVTDFAGWKLVMILMWLPIAALLALIFKPTLHPTWFQILIFFFAAWGAYLIRTVLMSLLGMITFWTTRVGAIYDLYFALELVLSGRLVPMPLMPTWVQHLANFLPFQWTFYFPINALTGSPTPAELVTGLGIQLLWFLGGLGLVNLVWHYGIRRFSSVGN
ncbi:MAG: ABC-2 family transporter protein [Anaerolineales bacterium]|jgi:ABC-2 type transport system permease protein